MVVAAVFAGIEAALIVTLRVSLACPTQFHRCGYAAKSVQAAVRRGEGDPGYRHRHRGCYPPCRRSASSIRRTLEAARKSGWNKLGAYKHVPLDSETGLTVADRCFSRWIGPEHSSHLWRLVASPQRQTLLLARHAKTGRSDTADI